MKNLFLSVFLIIFNILSYGQESIKIDTKVVIYKNLDDKIVSKEEYFKIFEDGKYLHQITELEIGKKEFKLVLGKKTNFKEKDEVFKDLDGKIISQKKYEKIFEQGKYHHQITELENGKKEIRIAKIKKIESALEEKEYYQDENGKEITEEVFDEFTKKGRTYSMFKNNGTTTLKIESDQDKQRYLEYEKNALNKFNNEIINKKLPDFKIKDVKGLNISKKDLENKIVIMNFWFTTCSPCIAEMPKLNKLVEKYKYNKSVLFLAPSFESQEKVKKFQVKKSFDFQMLTNSQIVLNDKLKIDSYPTTLLINKDGIVKEVMFFEKDIFEKIDNFINANLIK